MNFSDFCQPFYSAGNKKACGIRGNTSQDKIAAFLITCGINPTNHSEMIYSVDLYRKWFKGERSPKPQVWGMIVNSFDADLFARNISTSINESAITRIIHAFGISIQDDEMPDKFALSSALAKQFFLIAKGGGDSNNILDTEYRNSFSGSDYTVYIENSSEKYSKLKTLLYTSEEHNFYDFFVCNNIDRRINDFDAHMLLDLEDGEEIENSPDIIRSGEVITAVTMDKLMDLSKYTLLVGMGGIGKSMMMRHLFLSSTKQYSKNAILPILVILREFNANNSNLFSMIADSVHRFDVSFTAQHLHKLLFEGKVRLLLDGLDEIKQTDMKLFQNQLDKMIDCYPNNQIVMSTRRFSNFVELSHFRVMRILPFTHKQSLELIDKLEYCPEEPGLKAKFRERLISDYFKSHTEFVSNPLLLTLMLMSFHRFADIPEKQHLFYDQAYQTLLLRHDSDKLAYKRVFRSVNDPSDFTIVFREFCAKSYRKHDYEFSRKKFESYFSQLKSIKRMDESLMKLDNFIFDACHSVCLMYEEGQTYHFLHRSFQEYFYADYYSRQDDATLIKLGKYLIQAKTAPFDDDNSFRMLYDLEPEKVEHLIIFPYLQDIFSVQTEEEQFWKYFINGYNFWQFVIVNEKMLSKYNLKSLISEFRNRENTCSIKSVVQAKILSLLSKDFECPEVSFDIITDCSLVEIDFAIYGEKFKIPGSDEEHVGFCLGSPQDEITEEWVEKQKEHNIYIISDENGKPIVLGYHCNFKFKYIIESPNKCKAIMDIWEKPSSPAKAEFQEVRALYDLYKAKFESSDDIDDDDF